jgi:hypothetical protein
MSYFMGDDPTTTDDPTVGQDVNQIGTTAAALTSRMVSPVDTTLHQIDQGVNAAAAIAVLIPGVGPIIAGVLEVGEAIVNVIGIRAGADEANVITRVQTPLGNQLVAINAAIPYANPAQLQTMYNAVAQLGQQFKQFVASSIFTDGRASTQALNTIMPLVDGSGSYSSKNSTPGCIHCGPAGGGEDGIMGSIARQMAALGVSVQYMAPPQVTQNYGASYYPTLQSPSSVYGNLTIQSGTLPKYTPLTVQGTPPAVVSTGLFGAGYMPLIIFGGLLFLFVRKRG